MEATHLPPLLTLRDEQVELRYDVYCMPEEGAPADQPCAATGTVFVRSGTSGPFRGLALVEEPTAAEGRFGVSVPASLTRARDGFSYYAVFRGRSGELTTIPEGGESAPQRSTPMIRPVTIDLGSHPFGRVAPAAARVAEATWGDGLGEVGLEPGENVVPIGGSSFDVSADGTVHLLDEAHRRVLRWRNGVGRPEARPLSVNGTLADIAVGADGTIHVLESTADDARGGPLLKVFARDGARLSATPVGIGASQVRVGPDGSAIVHRPMSGQWQSATSDGQAVSSTARLDSGRPGRVTKDGGEVVVLRRGSELRLALVDARGRTRSWRVTSTTALGEVQLAEPMGEGSLLVVARAYSDTTDEFVVLVLDDTGLATRFSVASADWAETAPLSRFRLVGSSLYRLGSSSERVFVDRFDLEVPRR